MNYDRLDRVLVAVVIVLSLALGGGLTFATSLLHSSESGASAPAPQ